MMLSVLLITAVPARAGSIQFADVVQALADSQNARPRVELRLRAVTQSGRLPVVGSTVGSSSSESTKASSTQTPGDSQTPSGGPAASNVTSATGIEPAQTGSSPQVTVVDLGDVTGTVCDCGEIPPVLRRGGIPWWPLLGLGAVPFFFIERHKETPPGCIFNCGDIPPTSVPEPATLLLFGSSLLALGAGARRRRAQRKNGEDMLINSEEV